MVDPKQPKKFKNKETGKIYPHTRRHKCNSRMVALDIYETRIGKLTQSERVIFNSAFNMGYKEGKKR